MLAANHWSNFDPWPLGIPLFPRRFLRFMAKSELFWFPLGAIITAGGAFPRAARRARRGGDRDRGRALPGRPRGGHVPRGHAAAERACARSTRRAGARARPGSRSRPGPARPGRRSREPTASRGSAPLRVRYGAPIELADLAALPARRAARRSRPTGCRRPSPSSRRRSREAAARRRRRLVRASRVPRDPEDDRAVADGGPGNMLFGVSNMLLRLWQDEQPRTVLVAWDTLEVPDVPARGARRLPERARVRRRAARAARHPPGARGVVRARVAKAPGYEADDFLGAAVSAEEAAGGDGARRDLGSRRVPARERADDDPAAGARRGCRADRPGRGARALRSRSRAGARLHRAARRPLGPDPGRARASARRRPPTCSRSTGPSTRCSRPGRFAAEADALRLYRQIATLDRAAPLPPLPDVAPDWAAAAEHARELGMDGLAGRFEEARSSS